MEMLGLSVADGKAILHGVQDFVASQQLAEDLKRRRICPELRSAISQQRHRDAHRARRYSGRSRSRIRDGAMLVPDRRAANVPAHGRLAARADQSGVALWKRSGPSLIPFEKVANLLKEVLPVSDTTNHETVREHLQSVADRMEGELGEERKFREFETPDTQRPNNSCRMAP